MATAAGVTEISRRVDYSETDQMGVVYHARYLVWLDVARTEHLRVAGLSYREIEAAGFFLVVGSLDVQYRRAARYDDPIRVRTWVRERASRRITFGYQVYHAERSELLLTAATSLLVLDQSFRPTRLPEAYARLLTPMPDPAAI